MFARCTKAINRYIEAERQIYVCIKSIGKVIIRRCHECFYCPAKKGIVEATFNYRWNSALKAVKISERACSNRQNIFAEALQQRKKCCAQRSMLNIHTSRGWAWVSFSNFRHNLSTRGKNVCLLRSLWGSVATLASGFCMKIFAGARCSCLIKWYCRVEWDDFWAN